MTRAVVAVVAGLVALAAFASPAGAAVDPADRAEFRKPGPLRVVLVGDSITYNYQFEAKRLLEARGYVVYPVAIGGLSLLDQTICNAAWAREVRKLADPDFVVFEVNGNYNSVRALGACKPMKPYGSQPWLRRWRNAAINNQRQFTRRGAEMFWLEVPTVNFSPKREVIPMLNTIYRDVGETIDAWTPFGEDVFESSLHSDDQHLNDAGADLMAELVVGEILGAKGAS
jgi:hypothetical protein